MASLMPSKRIVFTLPDEQEDINLYRNDYSECYEVSLTLDYPKVKRFRLSGSSNTSLDFLRHLPNLQVLNICNGIMTSDAELARGLGSTRELTELELYWDELKVFPESICTLLKLESLKVIKNYLESIPAGIGTLNHLKVLNLGENKIKGLPVEISNLHQLRLLNLRWNEIEHLPPNITHLNCLESLNLYNNHLSSLPPLAGLDQLRELDLTANLLSTLPESINDCVKLEKIVAEQNQIYKVPSLDKLHHLTELDLSFNQISELDASIGDLVALEKLHLFQNQLTVLPPLGKLLKLKELVIDENQLASLPADIGGLISLTQLFVKNNKLSTLPPSIGNLKSLKNAYLNDNNLVNLPPEMGNLGTLERLDLFNNQLRQLPEIGNIRSLQVLNLKNNQLQRLPDSITQLTNLVTLDLEGNRLTELPKNISNMRSLKVLNLDKNQITRVPVEIFNLPALEKLHLSDNLIQEIPLAIASMSHLKSVTLGGNPLQNFEPLLEALNKKKRLSTDFKFLGFDAYINLFSRAQFKIMTKVRTTITMGYYIGDPPREPSFVVPVCKEESWGEIERAILRDARVPIPEPPHFESPHLQVTIRYLKRKTDITIQQEIATLLGTPALFTRTADVLALKDDYEARRRDVFALAVAQFEESVQQYRQQCQLLHIYVTDYLDQSPYLAPLKNLRIERKPYPEGFEITPTQCKPVYTRDEERVMIYELHATTPIRVHVTTEIRVHESGFLAFFVSTYHNGARAQVYFLSLRDMHFYTRQNADVKALGDTDNWALSYFKDFGYTPPPEPYTRCFICGHKLHYPAQPVKVGNNWVFMLKPCCACFRNVEHHPEMLEQGIERLREIYGDFLNLGPRIRLPE